VSLPAGARLRRRNGYNSKTDFDSEASVARQKKKRKTFHASVQVTRIEDWCVEAESEAEARALLASGAGERRGIGDRVYVEVQNCSE
jgi:hypothetical protein